MQSGAERLRWELDGSAFPAAIADLLERCNLGKGRARVRIAMTAGAGNLRNLEQGAEALLWITAAPCPEPRESVSLVTALFPRNDLSPLAGLKCASYAENLIALDQARRAGADEVLFFNTRGHLCEAAMANIFVVSEGKVFTPPLAAGCLPGTMREQVMERISVEEIALTAGDVLAADEVFLTSATQGVVPVSTIDGREILLGDVAKGLRTQRGLL